MNLKKIIKKPLITENSLEMAKQNSYTFKVDKRATKSQLKKAIEEQFKVEVVNIRTLNRKGKSRFSGQRRRKIKLGDWKKAMVQLKKGQKIAGFEVEHEKEK